MEFKDLVKARRSCRSFEADEVPDNHLKSILEAGHWAPSPLNRQPWEFIIITDSEIKEGIKAIAEKELQALNKREGLKKRGLKVEYSERMLEHLVKNGFDERYGARPLQRTIEEHVIAPIAYWLLKNRKVKDRIIKVDYFRKTVVEEV